jgi:methionine salvage enolase-phosphatase E1
MEAFLIISNLGVIAAIILGLYLQKDGKVSGVDFSKDFESLNLKVSKLTQNTERQDVAILGQNKAVSELKATFNTNIVKLKLNQDELISRVDLLIEAANNANNTRIPEVNTEVFTEAIKDLQRSIEAKEDSPIYTEQSVKAKSLKFKANVSKDLGPL